MRKEWSRGNALRGEKRRSTATDQNTALRVRARRGEQWSEHVDEQVGEGS